MKKIKGMVAVFILGAGLVLIGGPASAQSNKPDLKVQVIAASGGSTTFNTGEIFSYPDYPQLIVTNVGTAPATGHWIATYKCKSVPGSGPGGTTPACPTQPEVKFGTTSSPVLAPNQPWTLWVHAPITPLQPGKYIMSGLVELAEDTNTSNNYSEITITVITPIKPIPINAALVAPSGVLVTAKSSIDPTVVLVTYREHSEVRHPKGVIVERKEGTGGFVQIAKTVNSGAVKIDKGDGIERTYQDGPLKLGTAYVYRLKSYDDKGESGYSNEASFTPNKPQKLPVDKVIK